MNPPADSDAILVFPSQGEGDCPYCAAPLQDSAFVTFKNDAIACVKCGGLENLEFLPSGNTALTRRANALSAFKYVVLKFSRARKRYERQGILAGPEILDQARRECEADEAARESKRQASAARREKQETTHLAAHAFRAHIRHHHTSYDRLMSSGTDRPDARLLVAARIEETTRRWLDR
jgi:hypothetical protein